MAFSQDFEEVINEGNLFPGLKKTAKLVFFQPYRDPGDFFLTLTTPIVAPVFFGVATLAAAATAITAALAIPLFLASGVFLYSRNIHEKHNYEYNDPSHSKVFELALYAAIVGVIAAVMVPICALLTVLAFPLSLISIATRAGSSIAHATGLCDNSEGYIGERPYIPIENKTEEDLNYNNQFQ